MSWFDASSIANLAKTALKEAQRTIDKALEINEQNENEDAQKDFIIERNPIDEEPDDDTKSTGSGSKIWESLANSFFEKSKSPVETSDYASESDEKTKTAAVPDVITKQPRSSLESGMDAHHLKLPLKCEEKPVLNPPPLLQDEETKGSNNGGTSSNKETVSVVRRVRKGANGANRLSMVSNESDRKSTLSSDSVEVLGSTPDSDSPSPYRNSSSSVEILSSSSVEVLNSVEDPSRTQTEGTSSESVDIIPEMEEYVEEEGGDSITSPSESTLTIVEMGARSSVKDVLKSSSSMDTSLTEVLSPWDCGTNVMISEIGKRSRTDGSATTLDGSSCDEGTVVGSSSEEGARGVSVKSMLAEAMDTTDDWRERRDSSPASSSLERSHERTKIGSSGHTSADELETATSSDIDIIPSPNGDGSDANSRQSPAKLIYKNSKGKMAMVLSSDVLIPEIIGKSLSFTVKSHNREPSETSSGGSDDNIEVDRLLKKICELCEMLDARESKLVELSLKNAELSENNSNLKSQLEYQMNEEFTQRLAAMEKKFQTAIREKESLRTQLENSSRTESNENKDQIIRELREEGEKLSKQQLTNQEVIRKLRASEREHMNIISNLRKQYEDQSQELDRTKKALHAKEQLERTQIAAINDLTKNNEELTVKVQELQSELSKMQTKVQQLNKLIAEKNEQYDSLYKSFQDNMESSKLDITRKHSEELENQYKKHTFLEETIKQLQSALKKKEVEKSMYEQQMKNENQKLLSNLEDYKRKIESMSEDFVNVTKPISKQLEDEIKKYNDLADEWVKQEAEYMSIIENLRSRLTIMEEKAEKSQNNYHEIKTQLDQLENERQMINTELRDLTLKMEFWKSRCENQCPRHEKEIKEKTQRADTLHAKFKELFSVAFEEFPKGINLDKLIDDDDLYQQVLKILKQDQPRLLNLRTLRKHRPDSPPSPLDVDMIELPREKDSDSSSSQRGSIGPSSSQKGSVYEGHYAGEIEVLQSQLKSKDGMHHAAARRSLIEQLRFELKRFQKERSMLYNEVSLYAVQIEQMKTKYSKMIELQKKHDELLQLYGEKFEECQELRLDLEDIREMYKGQIDLIMKQQKMQ